MSYYYKVAWSVCLVVISPAKMAELTRVPTVGGDSRGPRYHVLDGCTDPPGRAFWGSNVAWSYYFCSHWLELIILLITLLHKKEES